MGFWSLIFAQHRFFWLRHTHRPEKIEKGETLYFNPGSPSLPRRSEASIGILHLWPEGIVAEHIVVS